MACKHSKKGFKGSKDSKGSKCLISGSETTVTVKGTGMGAEHGTHSHLQWK